MPPRKTPDPLPPEEVRRRFEDALRKLESMDRHLFDVVANERTIAARLMHYLVGSFPDHDVDVEYNRSGYNIKRIEHSDHNRVLPDIVIHIRGSNDHNLLVAEAKKSDPSLDLVKIREIATQHNFAHAALVRFYTPPQHHRMTACEWANADS